MHIQLKINGFDILSSPDITTVHGGGGDVLFQAACFFLALEWALKGGKL